MQKKAGIWWVLVSCVAAYCVISAWIVVAYPGRVLESLLNCSTWRDRHVLVRADRLRSSGVYIPVCEYGEDKGNPDLPPRRKII